jgi:hypothetical protein
MVHINIFENKFNLESRILKGIHNEIYLSFEDAIRKENRDILKQLYNFVLKIVMKAIRYKFPPILLNYLRVYIQNYKLSNELKNVQEIILVNNENHLREFIFASMMNFKNSKDEQEKENSNKITNYIFGAYSDLFYKILRNYDYLSFKYFIKHYDTYIYLLNYPKNLNQDKKNLSDYLIEGKSVRYYYQIKFILISWLLNLYQHDEFYTNKISDFLDLIDFRSIKLNDLIDDIFFFRNEENRSYINLDSWDYRKRFFPESYSPPDPFFWLTFGFSFILLKIPSSLSNVIFYSDASSESKSSLLTHLEEFYKNIELDFSRWNKLIGIENIEKYIEKYKRILKMLSELFEISFS